MSVVSLQVWHALKRPPIHHPLFRRVSKNRPVAREWRPTRAHKVALAVILLAIGYICARYYAQLILIILFFLPIGIGGLYMALHGSIVGLYLSTRVSSAIAREREHGIFDLLSTSPYGAFSASWAICTGCQYYDQTFNGQRVWFSRFLFLTMLLFGGVISLADTHYAHNFLANLLYVSEVVTVLALAFYIDDIHSTVIGSLVGLIVPQFARNRLDARVGAFMGFLLLQIAAYTLVWLIGFVLLPQVNLNGGFASELALPLEQFLVFFAVRELIARGLWRLNSLLLNDDVSDLRVLTKGGRLIC